MSREPRLPSSGLVPLTLEWLGHRAASHSLTEFGLKCLGGPVHLMKSGFRLAEDQLLWLTLGQLLDSSWDLS